MKFQTMLINASFSISKKKEEKKKGWAKIQVRKKKKKI